MNHRPETPTRTTRHTLLMLLALAAARCAAPATPPATPGASAPAASSAPATDSPATPSTPPGDVTSGGAPSGADPTAPKFDFEAMLARERQPSPQVGVTDPRGRWRASIEARRPPIVVDRQDNVSVRASIGTKYEIRCEVHDGQLNPGATITRLLSAASGSITFEDVVAYRVGSAAGAPVVFVRARYATRQTPPLGGELKLAISPGADYSFVCIHDEPGYRGAFARVVESLVSSFVTSTPRPIPQYSAIWQMSVGEATTGYSWERIFADADGSISSFTFDVLIAQLASGELRIRDDLAVELHDRRGVLRGNFLSYRGTTKELELEVRRDDKDAYAVRGNVEGKPLEARLETKSPLASGYELLLKLQKPSTSERTWRWNEYRPRLDALHAQSAEYSLDPSGATLTRRVDGKSTGEWTLLDGLPTKASLPLGPSTSSGSLLVRQSTLGSEPGVTVGALPEPAATAPLPLAERRKAFETHVFAETDHTPAKTPPTGVLQKVTYPAPLGANVAYVTPPRPGPKRPGVVWIGGGLDWGIGESAWKRASRDDDLSAPAFREAGLALIVPALRGSNENPGRNECFLGEVDDLIAAADYLAARPDVDPARIYLAGYATGGTLALLAAASSERFRAVFAFGPVGDVRQYGTATGGGCLPENASTEEITLRSPINFIDAIRTPTFVFEAGERGNGDVFDALRERASRRVHFRIVPGVTPASLVAPATATIARAIVADAVDDAHLVIEPPGAASSGKK
jgi:dienelactone hydrolase